jgi:hypothetical protein
VDRDWWVVIAMGGVVVAGTVLVAVADKRDGQLGGDAKDIHRRAKEHDRDRTKREKERTKYGVFVWTEENRYPITAAEKVYASEKLAKKAADKMNTDGGNYVVRPVTAFGPWLEGADEPKRSGHSRDKSSGQYSYQNKFERLCVCGHTLGMHTGDAPHECIAGDFLPGVTCDCVKFRLQRTKKP